MTEALRITTNEYNADLDKALNAMENLDKITKKIADFATAKPKPNSLGIKYFHSDFKTQGYPITATFGAQASLISAVDALRGVYIIVEARNIPKSSIHTLLRQALEGASMAEWLLGIGEKAKTLSNEERGLAYAWKNAWEQERYQFILVKNRGPKDEEIYNINQKVKNSLHNMSFIDDKLIKTKRHNKELVIIGPIKPFPGSLSLIIDAESNLTKKRMAGTYSVSSGIVHSLPWASLYLEKTLFTIKGNNSHAAHFNIIDTSNLADLIEYTITVVEDATKNLLKEYGLEY